MASFEELTQLVQVFNVVDSEGVVIERDVPADYVPPPGCELVFSREVPKFYLMQYAELFQVIIDKIKEVDSKV